MDIQIWQQKSPLHKGTGPGVQVERAAPETTQATAQCKSYKNHLQLISSLLQQNLWIHTILYQNLQVYAIQLTGQIYPRWQYGAVIN